MRLTVCVLQKQYVWLKMNGLVKINEQVEEILKLENIILVIKEQWMEWYSYIWVKLQ